MPDQGACHARQLSELSSEIAAPEHLIRRWWQIDILVVTDTIVSFGPEHNPNNLNESFFGMSHYDRSARGCRLGDQGIRSTDHSQPRGSSQLPLRCKRTCRSTTRSGSSAGTAHGLSPTEHDAMCVFMNNGGGVFATGDHAALGSSLAGSLPRVRSMRHGVRHPATRPDPCRHDDARSSGGRRLENQSDDIRRTCGSSGTRGRYVPVRQVYPAPTAVQFPGQFTEFPITCTKEKSSNRPVLDAVMSAKGQTSTSTPSTTMATACHRRSSPGLGEGWPIRK